MKATAKKKATWNGLVNRTPFGSTLDNQLFKDLNELHQRTQIPKSRLLDDAVKLLLKKHAK